MRTSDCFGSKPRMEVWCYDMIEQSESGNRNESEFLSRPYRDFDLGNSSRHLLFDLHSIIATMRNRDNNHGKTIENKRLQRANHACLERTREIVKIIYHDGS